MGNIYHFVGFRRFPELSVLPNCYPRRRLPWAFLRLAFPEAFLAFWAISLRRSAESAPARALPPMLVIFAI
jgi:hypothetical protein